MGDGGARAQSFNHPPIITSEFRPEYFLNKISNLALQCQAYSENTKYYWYQNGRKVENQIQITANITSGYLRITNYTKDNFGVFYCVAENDYGASVSPFVKISEAGNLHFLNVSKDFENKTYACGIWNEQTRTLNKGSSTKLFIEAPPVFPENGKSFLTTNFTIYSEEFIRLTCNAVSSPMENHPVVTHWMKNGSKITSFQDFSIQLLENNRVLKINRAVIEKVGGIQCVTENSEGIAVKISAPDWMSLSWFNGGFDLSSSSKF
uniref:Ig-like domain-containing protein n=1 Tax=Magallana gigas TaxID=29159 RepID=K1QVT8_MAGGI